MHISIIAETSSPMHSDEIVVSAQNLTKTFRIFDHPGDRIKQSLTFGLKKYHRNFTAIKDISFDIRKGEIVGIIGVNGSGKSTLLQLVCGILKPTTGSITVNGRVSALLELGAGFNPEFTGRENVYFQGSIIGLNQVEMDQRFDYISDFADIGEFIDQPVRTYSSGMYVRLAFSVAVNVDPEILVVDEALAVGDAGFRSRCFRRIGELRKAGCTILFVSHSIEEIVRICGNAMLLHEGELLLAGQPDLVVKQFYHTLKAKTMSQEPLRRHFKGAQVAGYDKGVDNIPVVVANDCRVSTTYPDSALVYKPNGAIIDCVRIIDATGNCIEQLRTGMTYCCVYHINFTQDASHVRCAILIKTPAGVDIGGVMSVPTIKDGIQSVSQGSTAAVEFEFNCRLNPGTYLLNVAVFGSEAGVEYTLHGIEGALTFDVERNLDCQCLGIVDLNFRSTVRIQSNKRVE